MAIVHKAGGDSTVRATQSSAGGIKELIGGLSVIRQAALSSAFRTAKDSNPRTKSALTASVVAFGGTPTAGTVGFANSGTSTANTTFYDFTVSESSAAPFRAFGGSPFHPNSYFMQGVSYYNASGVRQMAVWKLVVETDDPEPVFYMPGYSAQLRVVVDGVRVNGVVSPSDGGLFPVSLNLRGLGSGFHRIEVLMDNDNAISGLYLKKTSSLIAVPRRPVIAMFTDSLGNSSPDVTGIDCLAAVMADYLGADVRLFAAGGTGYTNPDTKETFINRIPLAVTALNGTSVDLTILAGGINDSDSVGYQAAVESTISAAKAAFAAPVCVFGSWASNNSSSQSDKTALEVKIKAAALAQSAVFVPVMTDANGAWITGSGTVEAPTGSGTADVLFKNADITHWCGAGHSIIGKRAAFAVASAFGL